MEQLFGGALIAFISIILTRWIFGIDAMLKAHKATIGLLIIIAKKHGASKEEIDEVLDKIYPK